MSEAKHFVHITRVAPQSDRIVLLVCFSLTVLFDMVIAVSVGVVLAALLFIRRMADLTDTQLVGEGSEHQAHALPSHIALYDINGPLFFGAAEKAMATLQEVRTGIRAVVIDMKDVPMMDMTGMVAFESMLKRLHNNKILVVLTNLSPRLQPVLHQAGLHQSSDLLRIVPDLATACQQVMALTAEHHTHEQHP